MPSVTVSDLITVLEIGASGRRGFGMTCRNLVTMPALTAMLIVTLKRTGPYSR
jgi:hypothetical protein